MRTPDATAEVASSSWSGPPRGASVVIATRDRVDFLAGLVAALEQQTQPAGSFEVLVVDDGSADGTWAELRRLAGCTPLPLLALRVAATGGPSLPRNLGAVRGSGATLVFTDDDCLPDPGWLQALLPVARHRVAQGATRPGPGGPAGAWDRTISVARLSGLFETCNLALPREVFLRVGGFPQLSVLDVASRGFGEDVLLGAAAAREVGAEFVAGATVEHRWLPATFADQLRSQRRLVGFPAVVVRVPELRDRLWLRTFLSRRSAATDLAIMGAVGALVGRRRAVLLTVPWLVFAVRQARDLGGRALPVRLAQLAVSDGVAAASLIEGSVRHRQPVL